MKNRQIIDSKGRLVKDMTKVVSKSLIALGDKKSQLPWFFSSVHNESAIFERTRKVS